MAIELCNFSVKNIVFEPPVKKTIEKGFFHRIPIKYIDEKGVKGDLCIETNQLMTWGIKEHRPSNSMTGIIGPVENYSLPLVIADEETFSVLDTIFEQCREHLRQQSVKVALQKFTLNPDTMNPFCYRRDTTTGLFIEGSHPTLYPKLITQFQKIRDPTIPPVIATEFVDIKQEPIDPLSLIDQRAQVIVALTIKEIYIGAGTTMSIQLKINDAIVIEKMEMHSRRLKGYFARMQKKQEPVTCILDDMATGGEKSEKQEDEEKIEVKRNRIIKRKQPSE